MGTIEYALIGSYVLLFVIPLVGVILAVRKMTQPAPPEFPQYEDDVEYLSNFPVSDYIMEGSNNVVVFSKASESYYYNIIENDESITVFERKDDANNVTTAR